MTSYQLQYGHYLSQVEHFLNDVLYGIEPTLAAPMQYSLQAGGKRLRPVLCLATAEMLKVEQIHALPFAAAIEMIHTYSLIHDDLPAMDDDDLRRGKPSCHKAFDEAQAILAGDGLLSLAMEIMLDALLKYPHGMRERLLASKAIVDGAGVFGMVAGQSLDIANTGKEIDYATLKGIHSKKTGALISASCLSGAYLACATKEQLQAVVTYGDHLGQAFQILDDILDVTSDSKTLGKTIGKDEESNKVTYVSLFGIEKARSLANMHVQNATEALQIFGDQAAFLNELASMQVKRIK